MIYIYQVCEEMANEGFHKLKDLLCAPIQRVLMYPTLLQVSELLHDYALYTLYHIMMKLQDK